MSEKDLSPKQAAKASKNMDAFFSTPPEEVPQHVAAVDFPAPAIRAIRVSPKNI